MKNICMNIAFALLLSACNNPETTEEPTSTSGQPAIPASNHDIVTLTPEQYANSGIETGLITQQTIAASLKVNGKIDAPPQSMVSISVPMGGYLKATKLLVGMPVKKGEIIATIEDAQYIQLQQDYLTAKAQFTLTESEYQRQKELNQSKASSDKIYEQAKANYEMQLVLLKSLSEKLKLIGLNPNTITHQNISKSISIYAPINGFVTAVNVNIGKYVNPSDVLFELVNPKDIHLTLSVFDKDIHQLTIGQEVIAYANSNPEKQYKCKIILISQSLNDQNAAEVQCHFEQYDKNLVLGKFMNAEIALNSQNAHVLPSDAIVRFEDKQYVFVVKGTRQFEMQEVQIGNVAKPFTSILNTGSLLHQTIVIKGAYNLLMSLKNTSED